MQMHKRWSAKSHLLGSASAVLMAAGAQAAYAADAENAANDDLTLIEEAEVQTAQAQTQAQAQVEEELEEIVVTGSRLSGTNITSPVPVVQVSSEEIDVRGAVRIEDVLNILPQAVAGQTSEVSNGASGTSTLNLRGLGAIRTLTLIDGKRLPFGSPVISAPNLDIVPTQLIERVDIVTGGASAVYGSDALGGVANFILKDDFEGIEIDAQVGFHQTANDNSFSENIIEAAGGAAAGFENPDSASDGRDVFAAVTMGANTADGKGNITMHFTYQNQNEILQRDRDISACAVNNSTAAGSFGGLACVGSTNFRRFTTNEPVTLADGSQAVDLFQTETGELIPFDSNDPTQSFNFGPLNFFQRPNERFTFYTQGHYDITDDVELYGTLSFMNNDTDAQIAPSASFNRPFDVNCDNPLLDDAPAGQLGTLFDVFNCAEVLEAFENGERDSVDIPFTNSHRNVEGGPRLTSIDNTTWRAIVGFRGELANGFEWDTFGQFSRVLLTDTSRRDLNFNRVQQALFVVEDENGNIVCRDQTGGCVPWNIFSRTPNGETLVTDAAVDFIQGTGIVTGETEQQIVGGTIQGDLGQYDVKTPFADSGVQLLVGWEYREDSLEVVPDDISQVPAGRGLTGVGGGTLPVEGKLEVVEGFFETQIPLVENAPFAESWTLNGAYRRSQYNTKGRDQARGVDVSNDFNTDTWFVGTTWSPEDDLRIRAQFQRSVRAPNVIELFTGQNTGLFAAPGDPCAGPNPSATFEQCARTGLSQSQFGLVPVQTAGQFNQVTGGNPELEPEVGDTITVGAIWTPSAVPGFSLAIDYFNIEIEDQIDTIPPQTTLNRCLETGNPQFCDLIQRDRFGSLFLDNSNFEGIQATNVNIATLETSGVDFTIKYDLDLADIGLDNVGSLNFDYVSTWTTEFETVPLPGADVIDCQDRFGDACGTPQPAYSHRMLATWNAPGGLQLTTTWRYFGSTDFGPVGSVAPSVPDETIESQNQFDLVLRWQANDNLRFRLGANNLFDNTPPVSSEGANGNTFPSVFDVDRFIFFGVNIAI